MGGMWMWWIPLIVCIAFAVWFARSRGGDGAEKSRPSPEDVVKRRYAEGEIDRETYEQMLADLRK
jgi:putative membrane protein